MYILHFQQETFITADMLTNSSVLFTDTFFCASYFLTWNDNLWESFYSFRLWSDVKGRTWCPQKEIWETWNNWHFVTTWPITEDLNKTSQVSLTTYSLLLKIVNNFPEFDSPELSHSDFFLQNLLTQSSRPFTYPVRKLWY